MTTLQTTNEKISLSECRFRTATNHGNALGVLKNLTAENVAIIGIQWHIDQAQEICQDYEAIKALEVDYSL